MSKPLLVLGARAGALLRGARRAYPLQRGNVTVTSAQPKNAKPKPDGRFHRWFARDASDKSKTAVVVRRNAGDDTTTSVEVFTYPQAKPKGPVTAAGAFPAGSKKSLVATKLF